MHALIYTQPDEVQYHQVANPTLDDGEVIIKIHAVGICGSDIHAYHGHDPRRKPGLILGHEFSGEIIASKHDDFNIGVRVTGNPLIACGQCNYCREGRDNLCSNRTMVGMTRAGAYAEMMSIPGKCLITLPDDMNIMNGALNEPAATAYHAIKMSLRVMARPLKNQRILILGGGAIGILAAIYLHKKYGVIPLVAEVNDLRRGSLVQHARCQVYNPLETNPDANSFDFVIDAVGSAKTRKAAFNHVAPGGVIMHIGLQDWDSEIDMRKLTLAEISLLGTYTYSQQDLHECLAEIHAGFFGDFAWVEQRPLAQGQQAFQDLIHGRTPAAKIILKP